MSDTPTANLALPLILAAQAQKHVTHNEALRLVDTLLQLAVVDRDLASPPGAPTEGQRWIIAASPTGAWAGHAAQIAAWQDGGWQFSAPKTGWIAFVVDETTLVVWNGSAWVDVFSTVTAIQNLARLGVGTTADATNPMSAKLNNALFVAKSVAEGGDGNLRYKLSKESSPKTLSFLFQDNFSGRAELGLVGDDDFHFKVSPDGSTWYEGLKIDRNTGKVSFPVSGGPREVLMADRTYYVRTDGSDSNDGLANTAGGAFLTIQKAIDTILGSLDLALYNATIQLADGTYTGPTTASARHVGAGSITIKGNAAAPGNVVVSTTAANCFTAANGAALNVQDMELTTTTSGHGLFANLRGTLQFNNLRFGACAGQHLRSDNQGTIVSLGNYAIVGGAVDHMLATVASTVFVQLATVTLTGTPAFAGSFARCIYGSSMAANGNSYSGAATGPRYRADANGVIITAGAGGNYFPGDAAGSVSNGGQYV